jgi:peptidyl-prolyl cis-trans isomerase D
MGWLEDSTTPDELKNAGLKEKGQLSGVIKSSVGFLVARLDDVQPAQVKPLSEARDDIAAKVKQEKALDAYYALQQKSAMRPATITNLWRVQSRQQV